MNLAWEWPLEFLAGTAIHRSLELRILLLPLSSLTAVLLYQGTNPAMYYLIGCGMYFWAYTQGEVHGPARALSVAMLTSTTGCLCEALDVTTQTELSEAYGTDMTWTSICRSCFTVQ